MRNTTLSLLRTLAATAALAALTGACGGGAPAPTGGGEEASAPTVTPVAGPAAPMGSASITGTITYAGEVPTFNPISMEADPACQAKHQEPVLPELLVLGDGNTVGNIFVAVKNPPAGSHAAPPAPVVIDQVGCRYVPHVVGVMAGQPLQFRNSDGILHNVHLQPKANREQNIGMPPSQTERDLTLNTPEPMFPVKCDVHPWMQAQVAVMSHPYFDVTDKDGRYEISGLPAGTYEVEFWHERMGTQTASLTVGDGETASHDVSFSAN
jgi:plastocyanin